MKHSGIEWIGDIPKEWKVVRTKNVFSLGKDLVGNNSSQTQLLSLTTKGIKKVSVGSTSGKVPNSYDTYQLVHKGNLVFCLFDLDCSAVFSGVSNYEGMISPAYKVVSMKKGFYPNYYGYWFDYIFDGRKYKFLSKNIRYSLTYDEFAVLGIVAPKFEEQQKIADYLDKVCGEVDEMVALQETMIEELKAYKQSVITEAVTKGLNPNAPMKDSGVDWIGAIPGHWDLARVGLFYFVTKLAGFEYTDTLMNKISSSEVVPIVRAQNVRMYRFEKESITEFIDLETSLLLDRCSLNKKSLLMTFIGAGIGDVCIFDEPKRYHLAPNVAKIEKNSDFDDIICDEYIMYYLGSDAGKGEINKISKASAQASLSMSTIRKISVAIPPIDEQRAIASYLDTKCSEIDALIAIKQQKIEELKDYKKSVIYEYVTGKKEVGG